MSSISFKEVGKLLSGGKLGKINPASMIASQSIGSAKSISLELFQYDFVSLGMKLIVYFGIALIFAKFMEAVIFSRGLFTTASALFGVNIPTSEQLPKPLVKLFGEGISGFKFWDIVKIVGMLLVIAELIRYTNANRNAGVSSSPMTIGIFVLLISFLAVTSIPELAKRIKSTDFNLESLR